MNLLNQTSPTLKKAIETANNHLCKRLIEEKKEKEPEKISSNFIENVKKMEEKYNAEKISNEHVMTTEAELQIPNPKKLLKKNPSKVKKSNFKAIEKKKRKLKKKSKQQNRKKV